jgi:hypothetical protein
MGFVLVETLALRQQRGERVELMLSWGDRLHVGPGVDHRELRRIGRRAQRKIHGKSRARLLRAYPELLQGEK